MTARAPWGGGTTVTPATDSYMFAYSGVDQDGISQEVSLLIDETDSASNEAPAMGEKLTAFLNAVGWDIVVTLQ